MRYFLGVDAGGSKTHALIADEQGQALGFASGGRGNPQGLGFAGQRAVLRQVTQDALRVAGLHDPDIAAAGFGLAGFDWPSQLPAHAESVGALGLNGPCEIVNDTIIGLLAGASQGWGIALVAGTGNNCRGRDRQGREGRITGDGVRFGEHGGGGELVEKAVEALAHAWSRRGPSTLLAERFIEHTGARDLNDLIEGIDLGRYTPKSGWAPVVFETAQAGDAVAREVIAWSARELGASACAVIRQLDLQDAEVEVVQIGGLFEGGALLLEPLHETIRAVAPKAIFIRLQVPPVIGSVLLALQTLRIDAFAHKQRLIETTRVLIQQLQREA